MASRGDMVRSGAGTLVSRTADQPRLDALGLEAICQEVALESDAVVQTPSRAAMYSVCSRIVGLGF